MQKGKYLNSSLKLLLIQVFNFPALLIYRNPNRALDGPQVAQAQNFPASRGLLRRGRQGSSKYKHRRTSALLRNIRNIRICMGKNAVVSVTYENERISIKNSLPYIKCVLRLSCVVHWPIYGLFMGCTVNSFLSI